MVIVSSLRKPTGAAQAFLPRYPNHDRRGIALHWVNFCVALWFVIIMNVAFWRAAWAAVGGVNSANLGFALSLPVFVLLFIWLALQAVTWGRLAKPVLSILLLVGAVVSFFGQAYGVMLDRDMVANVMQTHTAEALELLSWRLVGWVFVAGAIPCAVLWRIPVRRERWPLAILIKAAVLLCTAAMLIAVLPIFFKSYAGMARNHRDLRLQLVPTNLLSASFGYFKGRWSAPPSLQPVGLDAQPRERSTASKPRLLILVVGETARAPNFSLTGYARETNPRMAKENDLLVFRDVRACGTNTATSLPCMFLDVGRQGFESNLAARRESLLDVLQRAQVGVTWRDNNSGCKGICDRIAREDVSQNRIHGMCSSQECWDEVLLTNMQPRLDAVQRDTVVVLHMKGSHGPAYYLRYPPGFEYFTPVCRTNQLDQCERETIVNAYDNTLRYTDFVLSRTIELLRSNAKRFDTAMLYVSDHGESLGENGLYLHGIPYAVAPREQTSIPLLVWMPREQMDGWGLDRECMRRQLGDAFSHDSLYSSVLGLMGVATSVYRSELDLFGNCRPARQETKIAPR